jgi:hypothetical protein
MTGRPDRTRKLQDFLDCYLTPTQEAGIRRRLRESDEWRREYDELRAVYSLLGTPLDIDPPEDLLPGIFAALEAEAVRSARPFRLPASLEKGLVVAGAASVAGLLGVFLRVLEPAGLVGRATIAVTSFFSAAKSGLIGGVGLASHLDWTTRTLATLADAARTALAATAEPLLAVTLVGTVLTLFLGWLVLRSHAPVPEGGWSHGLRS